MTVRAWTPLVAALAATALIAAGCGGGSSHGAANGRARIVVLMASAPNSLDPAVGDTPEALEADWLAYTPLLIYAHADGSPGTQLIPGLAQTLPSISGGGLVYSFLLIKGLKYSDGQPVRASDFIWAVERAIRLWPQAGRLLTSHIVGAGAYSSGRSKTISGISADDATAQITIRLTSPYGAFEDVLALPALAPVPAGTPMTDQLAAPPPGVGPYTIAHVIPGRSFSLLRTPGWEGEGVADVPSGHLDIDVRITGDAAENARSVLNNAADVFDWPDQIPPSMLAEIRQRAASRYLTRTMNETSLIFLNTSTKPFSSRLAREAVRAGLDQATIAGLDPGGVRPGCYVLPPNVFGHPQAPCSDTNEAGTGDLALARALVKRSGMVGTPVVVWSEPAEPVNRWMAYYTTLLNEIGFAASLRFGAPGRDPQTGYRSLDAALPNPIYFYDQLTGPASKGELDDPYINTTVQELTGVPGSTVSGVTAFWNRLELYLAAKSYVAVFGYPTFPEFVSSRIDSRAVVFSPLAGIDWSSLRLK